MDNELDNEFTFFFKDGTRKVLTGKTGPEAFENNDYDILLHGHKIDFYLKGVIEDVKWDSKTKRWMFPFFEKVNLNK